MTNKQILTDNLIVETWDEIHKHLAHEVFRMSHYDFAREIEQAVLQSPEIQTLRNDAERYRYLKKGNHWIVAATQTGFHVDGRDLDDLIDGDIKAGREDLL